MSRKYKDGAIVPLGNGVLGVVGDYGSDNRWKVYTIGNEAWIWLSTEQLNIIADVEKNRLAQSRRDMFLAAALTGVYANPALQADGSIGWDSGDVISVVDDLIERENSMVEAGV